MVLHFGDKVTLLYCTHDHLRRCYERRNRVANLHWFWAKEVREAIRAYRAIKAIPYGVKLEVSK